MQPIRSQVSPLTQPLTLTTTQKFPLLYAVQAAALAAAGTAQVGLLPPAAGPLALRAEDGGVVAAAKVVLDVGHKAGRVAALKLTCGILFYEHGILAKIFGLF